jgi:HEXXH motif-containing protein
MLPAAPFTLPCAEAPLGPWRVRYLRRLARRLLDWPEAMPPGLAAAYSGVRAHLGDVMHAHPEALLQALSLPTIAAPLGGGDLGRAIPHLLLELARRGILPERGCFWNAPVHELASPLLGMARRYERPRVGVLFQPGLVTESPTEEWRLAESRPDGSFRAMAAGGWLMLHDSNPLAMVEAHPDKVGNELSLGGASPDAWLASLDEARARIARCLPELAREHAAILGGVVPVGAHDQISYSASYKEAIGLAYLSLHPSAITMTEALIHETQHSKANLLAWSDSLVENGDERYPSPVRPDPRPIWGVLLAVHAFLPVALFHRELLRLGDPLADAERFLAVCRVNHDGMETLRAHARPTELGGRLLRGMDALEVALWAEVGGA